LLARVVEEGEVEVDGRWRGTVYALADEGMVCYRLREVERGRNREPGFRLTVWPV
jgi:hypothetical protein